jgi:hypothetical protein
VAAAITGLVASAASATPLSEAREAFQGADFELALKGLDDYLSRRDLTTADRVDALVLRAQCHSRLDDEDAAVQSLCDVMKLDPSWEPDPNLFSPQEMRTFRVALAACPRPPAPPKPFAPPAAIGPAKEGPSWYERKIVWVGVGAAALTAVLLSGGSDSGGGGPVDTGVPGFPDPPSSPLAAWSP